MFSIMAILIYIPFHSVQGSSFSTSYQDLLFFVFLITAILTRVRSYRRSHCGFDLHFPDSLRCQAYFHILLSHLHVLF
jgi:hypothetical protein